MRPVVLSVAGSDPSGGAGIQADLKTAAASGVYGAAVLTALTAQNTCGVSGVHPVPPEFVIAQLDAVLDDLDVAAIKIGMLGSAAVAAALADRLTGGSIPVVLDPVMVATSGDRLLDADAVAVVRGRLLPLATVITPNLAETRVLLDLPDPIDLAGMTAAARALVGRGAAAALVKGGHLAMGAEVGPGTDVLADGDGVAVLRSEPVHTPHTHGTGCTLSTAIACGLARGLPVHDAVVAAKAYLTGALAATVGGSVGHGHGPVDHLWRWP